MFADVRMGVVHHHSNRFPAAELLECGQVAIGLVVPRRPSVTAAMRGKVRNPCAAASGLESRFTRHTPRIVGILWASVGHAMLRQKNFSMAMLQLSQSL